jgi:hypothetical protein
MRCYLTTVKFSISVANFVLEDKDGLREEECYDPFLSLFERSLPTY